jgi:hypothetical protein
MEKKFDATRSFTTDSGKTKKAVWSVSYDTAQDLLDQVVDTLTADVVAKHFCYGYGIDDLQKNFKPIFKDGKVINKPKSLSDLKAHVEKTFGVGNCTVALDIDKSVPDEQLKVAKKFAEKLPTDMTDEEKKTIEEAIALIVSKRSAHQ